MPDKPTWCGHLEDAIAELRALPYPWVDRLTLERVLRVRRRRAQQILSPCVRQQVGTNSVADREELITHLRQLAAGETIHYERRRRERFAQTMRDLNRAWTEQTRTLVEAPTAIVNQELADVFRSTRSRKGMKTFGKRCSGEPNGCGLATAAS